MMRVLGRTLIGVVAAMAIMALGASSASAIEIWHEEPGGLTPCGAVTLSAHAVQQSGAQCNVHATSTEAVDLEFLGVTVSSCANEFDSKFDSAGHGYLFNQVLTGAQCTTQPCVEAGGATKRPWESRLSEVGGGFSLQVTFCVLRSGSETNCTLSVPATVPSHTVIIINGESPEANCAGTGGALQVHGNWSSEFVAGETEVEVTH